MGYTPNLVEAGVFTSTDGLNLTKADEVRKLSEYSFSKGSVGEILASGILKGASS